MIPIWTCNVFQLGNSQAVRNECSDPQYAEYYAWEHIEYSWDKLLSGPEQSTQVFGIEVFKVVLEPGIEQFKYSDWKYFHDYGQNTQNLWKNYLVANIWD